MKNKKIISLSPALIRENLKMYWYLPVLSFIAYFMAGIFPLLMNTEYITDSNYRYLEDCLTNWNVAFCGLLMAMPLIAAVTMMGFLHNPARATAIHAQPFSRNKIFCSHIACGWLMCVLPVLAMTLIYLVIAGQPGHSLLWCASSIAILTFFYGTFVLAGSLVGNSVMHVLLCGVFFGIVPLILWLTVIYCENFLTGFYTIPNWMEDLFLDTNPVLWLISVSGKEFTPARILAYLGTGMLLLIFAGLLYERARLERVGDSMLFRIAEEIITWLIVFVGMTAFGFFFYGVLDGKSMMLVGMAFGTLLSFVVVKIIIGRTIKIVTRQNLISLGIYTLIAVLFTGCTMFGLGGYTKKVPDADDVSSIYRSSFGFDFDNYLYYDNVDDAYVTGKDTLTSEEAIEKVIALHQYIVDNKLYSETDETTETEGAIIYDTEGDLVCKGNAWITFRYNLKNGSQMSRQFDVNLTQEAAELITDILTCEEYKEDMSLAECFTVENINYIELNVYDYTYEKYITDYNSPEYTSKAENAQAVLLIRDEETIQKFLDALDKDVTSRSYTPAAIEMGDDLQVDDGDSLFYLDIGGSIYLKPGSEGAYVASEDENLETIPDSNAGFNVTATMDNTLNLISELLREEGYTDHARHIEER